MAALKASVTLVMKFVISVSYSVVLNGIKGGEFRPIRDLRQGDPLTLYLFIICAEGFSILVNMAKCEGLIGGARVGRGGIVVTHLVFADDNILFGEATEDGQMQ
ncbi:reverse transcriptase [Gossypium australe]|uniref:Reverse transcriptase n=1 Tax=Gossypium australe TaxID=47621 RepID=A0A5B6VSJ1_9ROSI|nr:reverse transcriptase [Gossypium australe]